MSPIILLVEPNSTHGPRGSAVDHGIEGCAAEDSSTGQAEAKGAVVSTPGGQSSILYIQAVAAALRALSHDTLDLKTQHLTVML